jgi:ribosomal protein L37E
MAYVIKGAAAASTSPLDRAPLDRAADCLRLARMGNGASRRMWNTWVAENPGTARIVLKWVDQEDRETAEATRVADKMLARAEVATGPTVITKRKTHGVCLKCGTAMSETKDRRCPQCGRKNRFYIGDKKMKPKKRVKAIAKAQYAGMLTKAAGRPVRSEGEAIRAMIAQDLTSPDPGRREAARVALARLR